MAFNIYDYIPARMENAGAAGAPPRPVMDGLAEAFAAALAIFPQMAQLGDISTQDIAENVAHIIMFRRPKSYWNCKNTEGEQGVTFLASPVIMRFPNLFEIYQAYKAYSVANYGTTRETTKTRATGTTKTSGKNDATATGSGNTKEKYNPVSTAYSKLSGETESSDTSTTTGNNSAEGSTNSSGTSSTERNARPEEIMKAIRDTKNPLSDIVDAIIAACVYTEEELQDIYYLDGGED